MRKFLADFNTAEMKKIYTDVLIIGSGIAGVYTALELNDEYKITLITKETGKCNNCNGMVEFPKDKQVVNVNNQFTVQTSANKDVNFFAIKKEIDDVEFLRKTLVNLSADAITPADI